MAKKILIINGPNLNMLGKREPEIYGSETLDDIKKKCIEKGKLLSLDIDFKQSNSEGEIVHFIQTLSHDNNAIIINAGAYTHTSVAIRDALLTTNLQIIEVHLSNIFKREEFRHISYISDIAEGMITGFGSNSYLLALDAIAKILK